MSHTFEEEFVEDSGDYDDGNEGTDSECDNSVDDSDSLDSCPSEATCCLHGGYCRSNSGSSGLCCRHIILIPENVNDYISESIEEDEATDSHPNNIVHLMEAYSVDESCATAIAYALTQSWGSDEIIELFVKAYRETNNFNWDSVTHGTWEHELARHGIE